MANVESIREIRFESSREFAPLLERSGVSLLVSTYQAGKLLVIGARQGQLQISAHNFEQAMGVAVHPKRLAVGAKTQIWFLESTPEIAAALGPQENIDGCLLTRSSHVTNDVHIHEMAWVDDELWFVNTLFSCLCTIQNPFSFVPRWRPRFISALAGEDRCHLNGMCLDQGKPAFVTAMSETDTAGGWRPNKATTGCLIDVESGETVCRGFAMPHSPRLRNGQLWVLDSGRGHVSMVDRKSGTITPICVQPGYTRGLDFAQDLAFVGLSKIRETSTFGGVPIAEHRESLKCGVAIIDANSGRHLAHLEFTSGVDEIFDVRTYPYARNPKISGPFAAAEGSPPIWYVPPMVHHEAKQSETASLARRHCDEGTRLADHDEFTLALEQFDLAIAADPTFAEAHCNRGVALQMLGRFVESAQSLEHSLKLDPSLSAGHINYAMTCFLSGNSSTAWQEYEWRWKRTSKGDRPTAAAMIAPVWNGESLAQQTLLVYGEQGIGDEIMFASLLPKLVEKTRRVIIGCADRLIPLFARSFPSATVVSAESLGDPEVRNRLGKIDAQIAIGSVPRVLQWNPPSASANNAFLVADHNRQGVWQETLSRLPGKKVGISWRGGANPQEFRRRSTALSDWRSFADVGNASFINLQYGVTDEDLAEFRRVTGKELHHWPNEIDPMRNMDEFAALVANLDQVVSIDNSTIHLSGALGVPTIAMVTFPSASYWRWFGQTTSTPWYSSLYLLRRFSPTPWHDALAEAAAELTKRMATSP